MKVPKYQLKASESLLSYEFISEGPRGTIRKRIQFTQINVEGVYNLAFGDKDPSTGEIDDLSVSNNGDSEKVLATVVSAVYAFLEHNPEAWIFASGSTRVRTRMYRMGISKFIAEVLADFEVYGQIADKWYSFEKDKDYDAFLVRRKTM